jgi:hypothetical protein
VNGYIVNIQDHNWTHALNFLLDLKYYFNMIYGSTNLTSIFFLHISNSEAYSFMFRIPYTVLIGESNELSLAISWSQGTTEALPTYKILGELFHVKSEHTIAKSKKKI